MRWLVNLWFVMIYILHVLVMIYDLWYMVWVGTLNVKKQKKQVVSGYFVACQGKVTKIRCVPGCGTRRTDQPLSCAAGPGTRRRERFAVCLPCDTRRSSGWGTRWQHTSPCARARAHDKVWSVRRVPPPDTRRIVVTLPCAKPMAHGKVTRNNLFFFVFSRLKYPLKPYIIDHIS